MPSFKDFFANLKKSVDCPKTCVDSVPYIEMDESGIAQIDELHFSKIYQIPEANYGSLQQDKQIEIATEFMDFMNSFDDSTSLELSIYNREYNLEEFKKQFLIPEQDDEMEEYREEYNKMLLDKITGSEGILKTEKYLTITVQARGFEEAKERFKVVNLKLETDFPKIAGDMLRPLSVYEWLELLHGIYNPSNKSKPFFDYWDGEKMSQNVTIDSLHQQGITSKHMVAPEYMDVTGRRMVLNDHDYVKSFYAAKYPRNLRGNTLCEFSSLACTSLVSIHFNWLSVAESEKFARIAGVNISGELLDKQKQASRNGFSADLISPALQNAKEESDEVLAQITEDDAKIIYATFVFTIFASSEEDLKKKEQLLKVQANKVGLTIAELREQHEQGLNTSLPLGKKEIGFTRMLTTQNFASFVPFLALELNQEEGNYMGVNAFSHNIMRYNFQLSKINYSGNWAILGQPGSGKSFKAKEAMCEIFLRHPDAEIFVIDPEREYELFANAMNGSVIRIAPGTDAHINPFDLNLNNQDDENTNPIAIKQSFIQAICEYMTKRMFGLTGSELSIIDRCVETLYTDYIEKLKATGATRDNELTPTMEDFYELLLRQPEPEGAVLALELERYIKGQQNFFSQQTNVDIKNRLTVFDIKNIGVGLESAGIHICLDFIFNRMVENKERGIFTYIFIDEFHKIMNTDTSSLYVAELFKRARKFLGIPCAITQNVEDLLKSANARTVLNNCPLVVILNQAASNIPALSNIFNLSEEDKRMISRNVKSKIKGTQGLLYNDHQLISFVDSFPTDTKLYRIFSTAAEETRERMLNHER